MTFAEIDGEPTPWALLLEADPSRERIESYLHSGTVVGMFDDDSLVGVFVLSPVHNGSIELMNIAVDAPYRGQGYGTRLLAEAIGRGRALGARQITVGTGNSSLAQLAFYQKAGFRIVGVDPDFFIRNYPEPIEENGIPCRDMIRLALVLE